MKKLILVSLLVSLLGLSFSKLSLTKPNALSNKEIVNIYSKIPKIEFEPTKAPLQMVCCYPHDETAVSYGARCGSGRNYCAENSCPEGTSECSSK
jgi:hypothetical protein